MLQNHLGKIRFLAFLIGIGIGIFLLYGAPETPPNPYEQRPDYFGEAQYLNDQLENWAEKFTPPLEFIVEIPHHENKILVHMRRADQQSLSPTALEFYREQITELIEHALEQLDEPALKTYKIRLRTYPR